MSIIDTYQCVELVTIQQQSKLLSFNSDCYLQAQNLEIYQIFKFCKIDSLLNLTSDVLK